jgi:hypothetical protein
MTMTYPETVYDLYDHVTMTPSPSSGSLKTCGE